MVDSDLKRDIKSGVISESYAEKLQSQRDDRESGSSSSSKSSSSKSSSSKSSSSKSSSGSAGGIFRKFTGTEEKGVSKAPTKEEYEEAESKDVTVSRLRRDRGSSSSRSSSSSSAGDTFRKFTGTEEKGVSKAPTKEEYEEAESKDVTVSRLRRDRGSSVSGRSKPVDTGKEFLDAIDKLNSGKLSIRAEPKRTQKDVTQINRDFDGFQPSPSPKIKTTREFEYVEPKPEPEVGPPSYLSNLDDGLSGDNLNAPNVKSYSERLKEREKKLKEKKEKLERDLDVYSTRTGYLQKELASGEKLISQKEDKLKALESLSKERPLTEAERKEYKKLYADYQEEINKYNERAKRLNVYAEDKSLSKDVEEFNYDAKSLEAGYGKLNAKIEKLNEKLEITDPTKKDFEKMGVPKKEDKIDIDVTAGVDKADRRKIESMSQETIPTQFEGFDPSKVPGYKSYDEKRAEKIQSMEKELTDDLVDYFGTSVVDEFDKKIKQLDPSYGKEKIKGVGGYAKAFKDVSLTSAEVAGARFQNALKFTSEKLRLEGAKSDNPFVRGGTFAASTGAEFFGQEGGIARLPYSFTGKRKEADLSIKRQAIDTPYERGVLAIDIGLAIFGIGKLGSGIMARRAVKQKNIAGVNKILDDLNLERLKPGKETRKVLKSFKPDKRASKSVKAAIEKLQQSTKGGIESKDIAFYPVGKVDDVKSTRRLAFLDDSGKFKGIKDSPVYDVSRQKQFTDKVTMFKRGKESGVIIGDTVYGTLDLGKGAKISYKAADDVVSATYRSGDDVVKKLTGKMPGSRIETTPKFEVGKTGGWKKEGKGVIRNDYISKQQRGVQFFDDKSYRAFETTGTQTAKTKVVGYDIDIVDTPYGRIPKSTQLDLKVPEGKTDDIVSGIDDIFARRNDGKIAAFKTKASGVSDTATDIKKQFDADIGGQKKVKSKFRQNIEDFFNPKKKKPKKQGLVEEEELLGRFQDSDLKPRQGTRKRSGVDLDDIYNNKFSSFDDFTKSSLKVKPVKLNFKPPKLGLDKFAAATGFGQMKQQTNKPKSAFEPFESFKPPEFESFQNMDPITKPKVDVKSAQSFDSALKAASVQVYKAPANVYSNFKPPNFDIPGLGIGFSAFGLAGGAGGFSSGSKRGYKNFNKGGYNVFQRKMKKLYKEIGL